ncbi:uncharacterized protein [Haliotis cracherodii]|uniref:uncharacterized protein n=1 Tax=Haliotis cracherodii TaxID=6455 RepID=UPI0039ECC46D
MTFYRRSEMDDLVFGGSLIEEVDQVDKRAECFSRCQRRGLCNLVLYNPLTRTCRLHSESFNSDIDGTVITGWQYNGISCANYKLENAREDVDIFNTDPKDVCNTNTIALDDNTSSCYAVASWEVVPVKCVSCYIAMAIPSMVPTQSYTELLPFALAAGMKLRLDVSGHTTLQNDVYLQDHNMDIVYLLSLRWSFVSSRAVFNTKQGDVFGTEEDVLDISVHDISYYVIIVHISESAFMTYVDGTLWMTNQMRLPFTYVRRVILQGLGALHSFHIGTELC